VFGDAFVLPHKGFFNLFQGLSEMFWYFYTYFFNFFIQESYWRVLITCHQVSGRSHFLGGTCDAIQWPNLALHHLFKSVTVFFFLVWRVTMYNGWIVASSRFFFYHTKCTIILFVLGIQFQSSFYLFIIFFLVPFIKVLFISNLVLHL